MLAALRDWMRNANRDTGAAAARALIDLVERRGHELDDAALDLIADALAKILRDVAEDMRPSFAERLQAARAALPLHVETTVEALPADIDRRSTTARSGGPDELLALAREEPLGPEVTHLLAARGGAPVQLALLANPGAALSASTLAMLAQLAISDLALKRALMARRDLPAAIRAMIEPYLSDEDRAAIGEARLTTSA
jgi:uncharacterized protein (DUF2336 family)